MANRWQYIPFDGSLNFDIKTLIKLSKAADPSSSSLAVYFNENDELFIWGMIDQAVHYQNFLNYEVESGAEPPGILRVSITDIATLVVLYDYQLVGKLSGNNLTTNYLDVFRRGYVYELLKKNSQPLQKLVDIYLKKDFPKTGRDKYWETVIEKKFKECLSRLLLKIQEYHHGGAILITPYKTVDLDIKYGFNYTRLHDCVLRLAKISIASTYYSDKIHEEYLEKDEENLPIILYLDDDVSEFEKKEASDELNGVIKFIASLSCVDGMITFDSEFNILGFGSFIQTKELPPKVFISKTATINNSKLLEFSASHFGTRHRSMFAYCWKYPGSMGIIISQDGDIRIVTKYNDQLIMWENIKVNQYLVSKKLKQKSRS